jgi:hypothetical protein
MKCCKAMTLLNDYVDGSLREPEATALAKHLDACSGCREKDTALRRIVREARDLPHEMAAPDDLWNDIAAEIARSGEEESAVPVRVRLTPLRVAAMIAALLLVVVAAGFSVWRIREAPQVISDRPHVSAGCEVALQKCAKTRAALLVDIDKHRDDLSPEMIATLDENLKVIGAAVSEIRNALEADPDDARLQRMLVVTCQEEVGLLARIVRIADQA